MKRRVWLPSAPLVERVEARGGFAACGNSPRRRSYNRAKASGEVSASVADALSFELLGLHPCEVWGESWYRLTAAESRAMEAGDG